MKWDENYPILFVRIDEKKKNNERQSREIMRPFHSKHCSYAFVYVYMLVQSYLQSYWYPILRIFRAVWNPSGPNTGLLY